MSLKQTKNNKREKIVGGESMRVSPWIEQKKDSVALSFVFCIFYFGSHNFFSFLFFYSDNFILDPKHLPSTKIIFIIYFTSNFFYNFFKNHLVICLICCANTEKLKIKNKILTKPLVPCIF